MTKEELKTYEKQLKLCPFCKKKAEISVEKNPIRYYVVCKNGGCNVHAWTDASENIEDVIARWNKRGEK